MPAVASSRGSGRGKYFVSLKPNLKTASVALALQFVRPLLTTQKTDTIGTLEEANTDARRSAGEDREKGFSNRNDNRGNVDQR